MSDVKARGLLLWNQGPPPLPRCSMPPNGSTGLRGDQHLGTGRHLDAHLFGYLYQLIFEGLVAAQTPGRARNPAARTKGSSRWSAALTPSCNPWGWPPRRSRDRSCAVTAGRSSGSRRARGRAGGHRPSGIESGKFSGSRPAAGLWPHVSVGDADGMLDGQVGGTSEPWSCTTRLQRSLAIAATDRGAPAYYLRLGRRREESNLRTVALVRRHQPNRGLGR